MLAVSDGSDTYISSNFRHDSLVRGLIAQGLCRIPEHEVKFPQTFSLWWKTVHRSAGWTEVNAAVVSMR